MGLTMNVKWQSSENYVNKEFLDREGTTKLIKTVEVGYKAVSIGTGRNKDGGIEIKGFSFFCDDLIVYAEMPQDEFILGLNKHTYLEFKRVVSERNEPFKDRFRLIGVRSVDSLDQHQVILLQGVLLDQTVNYLSLK